MSRDCSAPGRCLGSRDSWGYWVRRHWKSHGLLIPPGKAGPTSDSYRSEVSITDPFEIFLRSALHAPPCLRRREQNAAFWLFGQSRAGGADTVTVHRWCFNAGLASTTLAQHCNTTGGIYHSGIGDRAPRFVCPHNAWTATDYQARENIGNVIIRRISSDGELFPISGKFL